jgi:hypothetical protein
MLSRFSDLTFEQIKDAILNVNDRILTIDDLQALQPFCPTKEEVKKKEKRWT